MNGSLEESLLSHENGGGSAMRIPAPRRSGVPGAGDSYVPPPARQLDTKLLIKPRVHETNGASAAHTAAHSLPNAAHAIPSSSPLASAASTHAHAIRPTARAGVAVDFSSTAHAQTTIRGNGNGTGGSKPLVTPAPPPVRVLLASSLSKDGLMRYSTDGTPPHSPHSHTHKAVPVYARSSSHASAGGGGGSGPTSLYLPTSTSDSLTTRTALTLPHSIALSSIAPAALPSSREELRLLWRLTWPVAAAIMFRLMMSATDIAMLGHKDTDYLASAAAATIWINITSAFLYRAFGASLNTLCSQAFGAGNFRLVGIWFQQGLVFTTLACVPVGIAWWWTGDVLRLLQIDAHIADLAGTYARWSLIWLLPQVWMEIVMRYLQSQEITMPALVLNGIFVIINALLDLLLIFGLPAKWWPNSLGASLHDQGWGGLGFIGAPIATSISRWTMFLLYVLYCFTWRKLHKKTFKGWSLNRREALHPARIKEYVLNQVLPTSIGICLEEWQLEIVAMFATHLGAVSIATHNATLEIFFLLTSCMYGLVTAVQIRVAFYLGAGNAAAARQVAIIGMKLSVFIGVVVAAALILLRNELGHIYSDDPRIWEEASHIAVLTGGAYVALSVFYVSMAVLNGQARPMAVAIAYLIGCWVLCIPLAYVFAFTLHQGLIGLWYALVTGYGVVTIIVGVVAWRSDWHACVLAALKRAESEKHKAAAADPAAVSTLKESKHTSGGGSDTAARKQKRRRRKRHNRMALAAARVSVATADAAVAGALTEGVHGESTTQRSTTHASSQLLSDSSDRLYRSMSASPSEGSSDDSDAGDDECAFSDSVSSARESEGEGAWNAEEIAYRDAHIAATRRAALYAAIHGATNAEAPPTTTSSTVSSAAPPSSSTAASGTRLLRSLSSPAPTLQQHSHVYSLSHVSGGAHSTRFDDEERDVVVHSALARHASDEGDSSANTHG